MPTPDGLPVEGEELNIDVFKQIWLEVITDLEGAVVSARVSNLETGEHFNFDTDDDRARIYFAKMKKKESK